MIFGRADSSDLKPVKSLKKLDTEPQLDETEIFHLRKKLSVTSNNWMEQKYFISEKKLSVPSKKRKISFGCWNKYLLID